MTWPNISLVCKISETMKKYSFLMLFFFAGLLSNLSATNGNGSGNNLSEIGDKGNGIIMSGNEGAGAGNGLAKGGDKGNGINGPGGGGNNLLNSGEKGNGINEPGGGRNNLV
ncbi:MAG TPA: hypothetical protein VK168_12040 [Saprospiraceae bacterium]|nr:hypothetical protein [Saprospiraceae bacterium]